MKANMVKLALGIILILAGMGVAFMIWNLLMGTDVVYLPSRLRGISQSIPVLCSVPGAVAFMVWFFGRKGYVERSQQIDDGAFRFAAAIVLAICFDLAFGVVGLVLVGFKYITASIVAYGVSAGLQVVFCLLAFAFCPPYSRH